MGFLFIYACHACVLIFEVRRLFGKAGTPYTTTGDDLAPLKLRSEELKNAQEGLKKKINPKVMNMIDSVEKKEAALKNMMKTVIRDKRKIEETIINLNEYKKEALHKTWVKVNGKDVKYDQENTGYGWKTDQKIDAFVAAQPTSCQMKRPAGQ